MLEYYSNAGGTDKPLSGASAMCGRIQPLPQSSPSHDLDNFQVITRIENALGEFRRRDRLAVVLHHHAAGEKVLVQEELLEGARQIGREALAVGDDVICAHVNGLSNSLCVPSQIN